MDKHVDADEPVCSSVVYHSWSTAKHHQEVIKARNKKKYLVKLLPVDIFLYYCNFYND